MDREYGRVYDQLFLEHWWWRAREEFLIRLLKTLPLNERPNVLDVGCGNGLFFDSLERLGFVVDGLESEAALVTASHLQHRIHIGPFDRSFVPSKRYSLILMLDVLEHMPQPESALMYAAELLDENGFLVVTVPAFQILWTSHDDVNHHYTRYTKASFCEAAANSQLAIVQMKYFFHWLAALKLIVRFKERLVRTQPRSPLVPSKIVNRLLLNFCRVEQRICRSCGALPAGSSLLVVARVSRPNANSYH